LSDINKRFKIVVYTDSSNCNACETKFPVWKIKYRELVRDNANVGLIFIINTEEVSEFEFNANTANTPGLKLYDTQGIFKKNNNIFNHKDLHTFLLDRDNKILLVGNPLNNQKIFYLYKKTIESLSE